MKIISIGMQCTNTIFKREFEQTQTLPFDWMFSSPSFVFEMLSLLLDQNIVIEDLVRNYFFCCDKRAERLDMTEHYYTRDKEGSGSLYNTKYDVIFPHDDDSINTINKYIRRFERLKDIILNSTEELCFVYTSESSTDTGNLTIDGKSILRNVYEYLTRIYNLIGKFRNNYKMIVFDAIQTESPDLLNNNITLCKLNSRSGWSELLFEMRTYTHLFKTQ